MNGAVLYVGGSLPSLSETFVYRELLALRRQGMRVAAASIHEPSPGLETPELKSLAREAIPIYGSGGCRLAADAVAELLRNPARAIKTVYIAVKDAVFSRDLILSRRPKVLWQAMAGLALAHRARPLAIGHVHAHMAHVPATIAMYAAAQLGVPFSFTGHANDLFVQRTLLAEKLRRARFASCISEWHRRFYRAIVPLGDDRLPVVRCGVDVDGSPVRVAPASVDEPLVLSVGRLMPKKGLDVLIEAVKRLHREGCRLKCWIIGEGPQRPELETLIHGQSAQGNGRLRLLGARSNQEVQDALAHADLFVLPCRIDSSGDRDGIPVALMEAMAAGLCVISGDLPTIRELVRDGETGRLTPPGDVAALAAMIRELLEDTAQRERLAVAGREWVRANFSLEPNVRRLHAVLTSQMALTAHSSLGGKILA